MTPSNPTDVQSIICQRLIDSDIASGNIFISDQPRRFVPPAVFVSDSSVSGNTWEGLWETTINVSCVATSDLGAIAIAHQVRMCLDGWGDNTIKDVTHMTTIPIRTMETAPATHTRVVTFRVLHQELLV